MNVGGVGSKRGVVGFVFLDKSNVGVLLDCEQ